MRVTDVKANKVREILIRANILLHNQTDISCTHLFWMRRYLYELQNGLWCDCDIESAIVLVFCWFQVFTIVSAVAVHLRGGEYWKC